MRQLRILCGVALYLISPIDLAPEILLGPLGLADDLIVLIVGIRKCLRANN